MLYFLRIWKPATIMMLGIFIIVFNSCNGDSHEKSKSDSATVKKTEKRKGKAGLGNNAGSNEKIVRGKDGIYNKVEVQPVFPGGQDALASYIQNNVSYPDQALSDNISGTVRVSFVVDEHGKVTQPKVIDNQNGNKDLEDEAIRVVSQMPAWKPGKVKGRNVKTRLELPITFQMET